MRHKVSKNRLNVSSSHQKAIVRNMATSIILHERVKTTAKKASIVVPMVEKLITIAKKKDTMGAIRKINEIVFDKNASKKLMEVLKERYADKNSGFTRITKYKSRDGDNAPLVIIELLEGKPTVKEEKAEAPKAAKEDKKTTTKKTTSTKKTK
ncbi:50S ribosomal protein L17 [Candidatus Peregrinibacteria bacterium]|nr:50S ribosomal protein L17 [Candidatus Peregrinibacteria bacterium]